MMRRGVGTTARLQRSAATDNQHGALLRVGSRSGWPILEGARTLCLRGQVRPSVAVAKRSSWTLGFGKDGVSVLGPDEGFAAFVPAVDVGPDRFLQVADGAEAPSWLAASAPSAT